MLRLTSLLIKNGNISAIVVAPFWVNQTWFSVLIKIADKIILLEKSPYVFLPVNKLNRNFAGSTKWKIMILRIPKGKVQETKWFNLKLEDMFKNKW